MAYHPEGTYFIHSEIFKNEEVGSTFNNFVEGGDSGTEVKDSLGLLTLSTRKYATRQNDIGSSSILHNTRMINLLDAFREEIIFIVGFDDGNDVTDVNDYI